MSLTENMTFTDFDLIVIGLTLLSIVIGIIRGFSKEVLSIFSWAGAVLIALHLRTWAVALTKTYITDTFFAEPIGIFIVFFISFAILAKISQVVAGFVKSSVVGSVDRLLGAAFGVFRAVLFLGVAYMIFVTLTQGSEQKNHFLDQSKTLVFIQKSADIIHVFLPKDMVEDIHKKMESWVDEKLSTPKKDAKPEEWPGSKTPSKESVTADDLSKIPVDTSKVKENISKTQKEKLDKILESY